MFRLNTSSRVPGEAFGAERVNTLDVARRRLDSHGAADLEDSELVALLLGPGGAVPALVTAGKLWERWPDAAVFQHWSARVLARQAGISVGRARRLLVGLELGWRLRHPAQDRRIAVQSPRDLHATLRRELRGLDRERFLALYLDTRHRLLGIDTVSVGTLNASLVHPREVFKGAIGISAAALVVAHNHPSGCARPSGDDMELTARLDRCADLLGIPLLDHLVVGSGDIISIREYGWPTAQVD